MPSQLRQALHLRPGDRVHLTLDGERLVLEPERTLQARLVKRRGRKVLVAPAGAPRMTTQTIKAALTDFP
ncbi:MAG: AbrB/MazE/SpoVT family DNA-binding domain-containing protein [Verrucomicrobia bacterium]|nr:AbrB/MazE/SpoVT family DNA-binding domain-containing protein [Verrucomicrobiota bacterium]